MASKSKTHQILRRRISVNIFLQYFIHSLFRRPLEDDSILFLSVIKVTLFFVPVGSELLFCRFFFSFYSYKIIHNNVYALLYLSKTTRQHHRDNTKGSEQTTTTPRPRTILIRIKQFIEYNSTYRNRTLLCIVLAMKIILITMFLITLAWQVVFKTLNDFTKMDVSPKLVQKNFHFPFATFYLE